MASFESRALARDGRFERVEIDGNGDDLRNRVFFGLRQVLEIGAIVENRTENLGVEGLHAPSKERRKPGEFVDVARRYAVIFEKSTRSAGCIDFYSAIVQRSRQFRGAGFVGERNERRLSPQR